MMSMKKFVLTILLGIIIIGITGCGKIDDSLKTQENGYKLVSSLKNQKANLTSLVQVNGALYSKSSAILDYLENSENIGVVDKIIDSIYIPKLDFETNNKDLLNATVFEGNKDYTIVLYYNNEYVLFEKVLEK